MEISIRAHEEKHVLDVSGELDLYNAYRLREAVQRLAAGDSQGVVLNLKGVRFIDSSGVAALLSINALLTTSSRPLRICNVSRSVQRVFELTRLSGFLPIVASELDALESLRGGPAPNQAAS
ncbi:MAG TPA: STAS domain-containing protein [Spirochaetia bacterium]|nr:STAS domain-containing protein [Spirochaetia bacterium]